MDGLEERLHEVGKRLAKALPSGRPQPARRRRRQGDGARLPGRGAQGRAVPLRRRRPRLPLARRPRAPPHRLPRRGRDPAAAGRRRHADGQHARRPHGARRRRGGGRQAHGAPLHRRREPAGRARHAARAVEGRRRVLRRPARRGDRHPGRGAALRRALRRGARDARRRAAQGWPERPALESDGAGPLPRANLSVKVSALTPLLRPDAPERGKRDAADRLRGLLRRARELGAHLHIDMESLDSRDAVLELVLELLAEAEFRDGPSAGIVLQAYLRDSPETLDRCWTGPSARAPAAPTRSPCGSSRAPTGTTRSSRPPSTAGPRRSSRSRPTRTATSSSSPAACSTPARAPPGDRLAQPALGRARDRLRRARRRRRARPRVAGPARPRRPSAARARRPGLRVRTYCPVGDLVAGMAYLVRRLLENTSNESFLADQAKGVPLEELLAAP